MSNKFDAYDDNDEITLSSTVNDKAALKKEITNLKKELESLKIKATEYEEVIKRNNVKPLGICALSEDDVTNLMINNAVLVT